MAARVRVEPTETKPRGPRRSAGQEQHTIMLSAKFGLDSARSGLSSANFGPSSTITGPMFAEVGPERSTSGPYGPRLSCSSPCVGMDFGCSWPEDRGVRSPQHGSNRRTMCSQRAGSPACVRRSWPRARARSLRTARAHLPPRHLCDVVVGCPQAGWEEVRREFSIPRLMLKVALCSMRTTPISNHIVSWFCLFSPET